MSETIPEAQPQAEQVPEAAAAQEAELPQATEIVPPAAPQPGFAPPPPAQFLAFPEQPQQPPKPKRHFPWRWAGAVVVMLAVGAGSAFGVMAPKRTDLPGLATASDGRYDFATLSLPTLAPGQADPTASANAGEQHLSDIRKLLLSAPRGAVRDRALPGSTGWLSQSATLALLDPSAAPKALGTDGWRHTAGVGWSTADGAQTQIYLIQFIDNSAASDAAGAFSSIQGVDQLDSQSASGPGETVAYTTATKGGTSTRYALAQIGDTELLLIFKAPAKVGLAPFEQEMFLQMELLQ